MTVFWAISLALSNCIKRYKAVVSQLPSKKKFDVWNSNGVKHLPMMCLPYAVVRYLEIQVLLQTVTELCFYSLSDHSFSWLKTNEPEGWQRMNLHISALVRTVNEGRNQDGSCLRSWLKQIRKTRKLFDSFPYQQTLNHTWSSGYMFLTNVRNPLGMTFTSLEMEIETQLR